MLIRRDVGETYGGGNIRGPRRHTIQILKRRLIWINLLSTVKRGYSLNTLQYCWLFFAMTAA